MLIIGTMIGAGFCSGREIVSFFGEGVSVFAALLCGVSIFFVCVLFLTIGSKIGEKSFDKVNAVIMGKYHFLADVFLLLNNLIVLSAMIAGLNSLLKPIVPIPVFGVAAAVLCAVIASKGAKGLLNCNFFVVPIIIAVIAVTCFASFGEGMLNVSAGRFGLRIFPVSVMYVSMNMMLASTVLTTLGKLSRKQILLGSFIAAAFITALLALIITAINCTGNYSSEMPVLEIAGEFGNLLYVLLAVVIGISIFTTMLTAVGGITGYLKDKTGGNVFNSAVTVIAGTVMSFLGFTRVVSLFYPLVGVIGIAYIILCIKYVRKHGIGFGKSKRFCNRGKCDYGR